jgi:hypothetical protein
MPSAFERLGTLKAEADALAAVRMFGLGTSIDRQPRNSESMWSKAKQNNQRSKLYHGANKVPITAAAAPVRLTRFFSMHRAGADSVEGWAGDDFLPSRAGLSNLHQACRGKGAGLSLSSGIKPHASDVSTAD